MRTAARCTHPVSAAGCSPVCSAAGCCTRSRAARCPPPCTRRCSRPRSDTGGSSAARPGQLSGTPGRSWPQYIVSNFLVHGKGSILWMGVTPPTDLACVRTSLSYCVKLLPSPASSFAVTRGWAAGSRWNRWPGVFRPGHGGYNICCNIC